MGEVMTTRAARLSENGKVIVICVLFPIFWPFLPGVLIRMAADKIRDAYRRRASQTSQVSDVALSSQDKTK